MLGELFDARTGFSSVMAFRTGATTGVGVKALSRPNSKIFGLLGTGGQAINKLLAIDAVREISKVKVFSRNFENDLSVLESSLKIFYAPPDTIVGAGEDL